MRPDEIGRIGVNTLGQFLFVDDAVDTAHRNDEFARIIAAGRDTLVQQIEVFAGEPCDIVFIFGISQPYCFVVIVGIVVREGDAILQPQIGLSRNAGRVVQIFGVNHQFSKFAFKVKPARIFRFPADSHRAGASGRCRVLIDSRRVERCCRDGIAYRRNSTVVIHILRPAEYRLKGNDRRLGRTSVPGLLQDIAAVAGGRVHI